MAIRNCHLITIAYTAFSYAAFPTAMSSSTSEIRNFLITGQGTENAKLVFVNQSLHANQRVLCYIDFSEINDTPKVHTMPQTVSDAHVPVISADGKWVTYATGEGTEAGSPVSRRSSVYICRLKDTNALPVLVAKDSACEPRFIQNIQNPDTVTLIYATLAPNYAWEGFGKTMKATICVVSDTPAVIRKEIFFDYGSYTGGLSWDNRYLCGGGGTVAILDLQSGKKRPDTITTFAQACNASISSSMQFTNTMMYLTMSVSGTIPPHINNGKPWGTWEVILINNALKRTLKGYTRPDSASFKFPIETNPPSFTKAKWHHCEWSNHPYFAAATINAERYFSFNGEWVNTYYQERIYLINLKDSSYLEVMRLKTIAYDSVPDDNSGLHWPYLWVRKPANFTESTQWMDSVLITSVKHSEQLNNPGSPYIVRNSSFLIAQKPLSGLWLYTINGRLVQGMNVRNGQRIIPLPFIKSLSKGIYILKIESAGHCKNIPLIIGK